MGAGGTGGGSGGAGGQQGLNMYGGPGRNLGGNERGSGEMYRQGVANTPRDRQQSTRSEIVRRTGTGGGAGFGGSH